MARIPLDQLQAFLRTYADTPPPAVQARIPYPSVDQVLYAAANPDGTRKQCGNCYKWDTNGACVEVGGRIATTQVCGYHRFGAAQGVMPIWAPTRKVTPTDAGLIDAPTGTSCDRCRFYEPDTYPDLRQG